MVNTNSGGRATCKNASKTEAQRVRAGWDGRFIGGFEAAVAYTHLDARFTQRLSLHRHPGSPHCVSAGSRLRESRRRCSTAR